MFIILAFSQVFDSNLGVRISNAQKDCTSVQSQFVESNSQIVSFGDLTSGQYLISGFFANTDYSLPKFKTKDLQAKLFYIAKKGNKHLIRTLSLNSFCFSIVFIPIFLQTRNLLL